MALRDYDKYSPKERAGRRLLEAELRAKGLWPVEVVDLEELLRRYPRHDESAARAQDQTGTSDIAPSTRKSESPPQDSVNKQEESVDETVSDTGVIYKVPHRSGYCRLCDACRYHGPDLQPHEVVW